MSKEQRQERKEKKQQLTAEKKTKKLEAKEARRKAREKPYRVHVEVRNRLIQILIWLILLFFVALGAFSFATREDSASVKRTLNKAAASVQQTSSAEEQASAMAVAFVYDYFTYNPQDQDGYLQRINSYAANGLTFELPAHGVATTVTSATVKDVIKGVDGAVDVTVQTRVVSEPGEGASAGEHIYQYRVALYTEQGNCAVLSEPLLVADSNRAKRITIPEQLAGETVSEKEQKQVEILAGNFLKAYYGTNQNELLYFVTQNFGSTATVGSNFQFQGITDITVVPAGSGAYEAEVKYQISDSVTELKQKVYLSVVTGAEGRLYVDQMQTRR